MHALAEVETAGYSNVGIGIDECSGVRMIFERGEAGNLRIMKTKKRSSSIFNPFFCPDLGEDQKKVFHSDSARFSAQVPRGEGP